MISDQQIQNINNDGYALLDLGISSELLARLETIFHSRKEELLNLSDWAYLGIFRKSHEYIKFLRRSGIIEIAQQLIGDDVDLFWDSVVTKPAQSGKAFLWHQDSGYGITEPLEYYTFWIPFQKTTIENGCMWVLPGSHKDGLVEHGKAETSDKNYPGKQIHDLDVAMEKPIEMEAGQVLIFSSLLMHRSGLNTSDQDRSALAFAVHQRGYQEINRPPHLQQADGLRLS